MNGIKTVLNWSSGKDAALVYHLLQKSGEYEVTRLLTTVNDENGRIVMHGVREELLVAQAAAMRIPLQKLKLPASPNDEVYKETMRQAMEDAKQQGITTAAFGDILLEDLKMYREEQLKAVGVKAIFPLWQMDSVAILRELERAGIEAMIVCVNEKYLGKEFLGRKIDSTILQDLPDNVNPCGEYGEFHTFVYNAPFFNSPIAVAKGEIVYKKYTEENTGTAWDKGFYFLDLRLNK